MAFFPPPHQVVLRPCLRPLPLPPPAAGQEGGGGVGAGAAGAAGDGHGGGVGGARGRRMPRPLRRGKLHLVAVSGGDAYVAVPDGTFELRSVTNSALNM